jgi:hypothetical protein
MGFIKLARVLYIYIYMILILKQKVALVMCERVCCGGKKRKRKKRMT